MRKQRKYNSEEEILHEIDVVRGRIQDRLAEADGWDARIAEARAVIVINNVKATTKKLTQNAAERLEAQNGHLVNQIQEWQKTARKKSKRASNLEDGALPNLGRLLAKMRTELLPYDGNTDRSVVL